MSIDGQIKFFYKSYADITRNPTYSALSNESFLNYIGDRLEDTFWVSSGSDDTTTEYIEIEFDQPRAIDRIALVKNNFKEFNVKYDVTGSWTNFTNVETLEGTQSNISETNNTKETNYYQFTQVTTSKVRLEVTKTQTADQEKQLYEFIVTGEIGTLTYWPTIGTRQTKNKLISEVSSGRRIINDNIGAMEIQLTFANYDSDADLTIVETLLDSATPFLIYLCGADETQFSSVRRGYRLEDFYLVKVDRDPRIEFTRGLYGAGQNFILSMVEHV